MRWGIAAALAAVLAAVVPAAAAAAPRVDATYGVRVDRTAVASGRVIDGAAARRVVVEVRGNGPAQRRTTRLSSRRFSVAFNVRPSSKALRVRVTALRGGGRRVARTRWTRLSVASLPPTPARIADVPAAAVASAPAAGQPGTLTLTAATTTAAAGDYLALGVTPATPLGLLARVLAVSGDGRALQITPAALTDLVPAGAIDVTVGGPPAGKRAQAPSMTKAPPAAVPSKRTAVECTGGGGAKPELLLVDHELKLNASTHLAADWSWGLPPTITLTAEQKVWADYKIGGVLGASGQCELQPTSITPEFPLGQYPTVIAGVPVVITAMGGAQVTGKVKATFGLRSTLTARASATARLHARNTKITPSGGVDVTISKPRDVVPRPDLSAEAEIKIGPYVDLVLNGLTVMRGDLAAGLKLQASPLTTPTSTLSALLDLGAELRLEFLGHKLVSPRLTIWSREWPILTAGNKPQPAAGKACDTPLLTRPTPGFSLIIEDLKVNGLSCDEALKLAGLHIAGKTTGDYSCTDGQTGITSCTHKSDATHSFTFRFGGDAG